MKKIGICLMNVGTPDAPNRSAVRRYLSEFLTDPRVVSIPSFLRYLLVYGLIVPFRAGASSEAYQSIWDSKQGSPLLFLSREFQEKLQDKLGEGYVVELGMRYGQPNIKQAIDHLLNQSVDKIILLPLYPQYASASTGTALQAALEYLAQLDVVPKVQVFGDFYNEPSYITSLAKMIQPILSETIDCVVMSYHGLPFNQVKRAETETPSACLKDLPCPEITKNNCHCYRAQCFTTSRLLANALNIEKEFYSVSFQSRVGMNRWIGPDTEGVLKMLIGRGKKNVLVVCPSFVTDCLETIEEIGIRAKELWQKLGGETLTLVPCLNSNSDWVDGMAKLIQEKA